MGRTGLIIAARLPGGQMNLFDAMVIELVKPMAGNFPINQAQNFVTDPAAMTYTSASYLLGEVVPMPFSYQQFLFATTGGITLTAVSEVDGQLTTGSVSATVYKEVNETVMPPVIVQTGCTSNLGGLTFTLQQMNMPFQSDSEWTPTKGRSREEVLARLLQDLQYAQ
jgi:hypothetical protein